MNISTDNPVYLNLSPQDVQEISEQMWDTLRVLVLEDERLCVATGYGNTHSTMVAWLKRHLQTKRVYTYDSIVYFEGKVVYANDTYYGKGDKIPAKRWGEIYTESQADMLKLLATERGLRLE